MLVTCSSTAIAFAFSGFSTATAVVSSSVSAVAFFAAALSAVFSAATILYRSRGRRRRHRHPNPSAEDIEATIVPTITDATTRYLSLDPALHTGQKKSDCAQLLPTDCAWMIHRQREAHAFLYDLTRIRWGVLYRCLELSAASITAAVSVTKRELE